MKLENIYHHNLRNEAHFQFCEDFGELMAQFNPAELKIDQQFYLWQTLFGQEDDAFKKIVKSAHTEKLQEADRKRDETYRGMLDVNKAALRHFDPNVKEAAKRLQIVFDT